MAAIRNGSDAVRNALADALDWIAVKVWALAHWLRPVYNGPLCPDCQLGPELPKDEECPICREQAEHQRELNEIDRAAYSTGYQDAMRTVEEFG